MDATPPAPHTPLKWAHIARTEGDVRITMSSLEPADAPPWVMQLPYEWADEVATVLVTDQLYAIPTKDGQITVAYLPNYPEPGDGTLLRIAGEMTADFRNATHRVRASCRTCASWVGSCAPASRTFRRYRLTRTDAARLLSAVPLHRQRRSACRAGVLLVSVDTVGRWTSPSRRRTRRRIGRSGQWSNARWYPSSHWKTGRIASFSPAMAPA
jgi:hypothetical protein